jgi:hypothetical protein
MFPRNFTKSDPRTFEKGLGGQQAGELFFHRLSGIISFGLSAGAILARPSGK